MRLSNAPAVFAAVSFAAMWGAAHLGIAFRKRKPHTHVMDELRLIIGAALTLLGLLIGFSFSMSVSRYDLRKSYEAEEANAIGTEYLRVTLLSSAAEAARLQTLLRAYLEQRIRFYTVRDEEQLDQIARATTRLQHDLWSGVQRAVTAQPSALGALVGAGMNDVLNMQGYAQAAWWNRIPRSAWALMFVMGLFCNVLVGFSVHDPSAKARVFFILPLIVATSFLLIADLDSPRHGVIRVSPMNLASLNWTLAAFSQAAPAR
jgi:hypothetical protein